jgi:hypothetical protein
LLTFKGKRDFGIGHRAWSMGYGEVILNFEFEKA